MPIALAPLEYSATAPYIQFMSDEENTPSKEESAPTKGPPPHVMDFATAIRAFEKAVSDDAWNDGFSAGWDAGVKWLREKIASEAKDSPPVGQRPPQHVAREAGGVARALSLSRHQSSPPAKPIVLEAIRTSPGLRGVELLENIQEDSPAMHERTFRTALHRLKTEKKIENVDGRWYLKGTAPASTQPELLDDPDAPA